MTVHFIGAGPVAAPRLSASMREPISSRYWPIARKMASELTLST